MAIVAICIAIYSCFARKELEALLEKTWPKIKHALSGGKLVETTAFKELRATETARNGNVIEINLATDLRETQKEIPLASLSRITYKTQGKYWTLKTQDTYYILEKHDYYSASNTFTNTFGEPEKKRLAGMHIWHNKPLKPNFKFMNIPAQEAADLLARGFLAWPEAGSTPGGKHKAAMVTWGSSLSKAEEMGIIRREEGGEDLPLRSIAFSLCCPVQIGNMIIFNTMSSELAFGSGYPAAPITGLSLAVYECENDKAGKEAIKQVKSLAANMLSVSHVLEMPQNDMYEKNIRIACPGLHEVDMGLNIGEPDTDSAVIRIKLGLPGFEEKKGQTPLYREGALVAHDAAGHGVSCKWVLAKYPGLYTEVSMNFPVQINDARPSCIWRNHRAEEIGFASVMPAGGYQAILLPLKLVDWFSVMLSPGSGEARFMARLGNGEQALLFSTSDLPGLREAAPLLADLSGKTVTFATVVHEEAD